MDFTLSEEQVAVSELAAQIFDGSAPVDRVRDIEASDTRFDRELWAELAASNLLGVAIPRDHGGLGFGIFELALILEQQGRAVAPVPLLATLAMGALPVAEFGAAAHGQLLAGVASGDVMLTGAYQEWGANDPFCTSVRAEQVGDEWVLSGSKPAVPAAHISDRIVVPADTPSGLTLFLVDPASTGVAMHVADTTNRELHSQLDLDTVPGEVLGSVGQGRAALTWTLERVDVAAAAIAVGCCDQATRMAADYTSAREQFGRPLSHNQAVTQRAADCYIRADAMRLVLWQAAWRLDAGHPAAEAVRVAKWWAAEGGQRVVHDVQHLHGGMGADVDYPVHRYFLWVKQLENTLGGGSQQLARLGSQIAVKAKTAAGTG